MGSDLSDLSFKCFCDPDEVFGPVWWSTNIRTFWRNFLRLQPTKMVIEPTRDGMKWGTSSKKCDVKPLSSCLVVWDIYMCLPTCIYTYLHVCIYIYLNVSTCISMCFCICIYIYIYTCSMYVLYLRAAAPAADPGTKHQEREFFSL